MEVGKFRLSGTSQKLILNKPNHSFFHPILVIVLRGVPKPVIPFCEANLFVPDFKLVIKNDSFYFLILEEAQSLQILIASLPEFLFRRLCGEEHHVPF